MARRGFKQPYYMQIERSGFSVMTLMGGRHRVEHCPTFAGALKSSFTRNVLFQCGEYGEVDPGLATDYRRRYGELPHG